MKLDWSGAREVKGGNQMAKKNPYDDLYNKIAELLVAIKTYASMEIDEDNIPPDIEKRLDQLHRKLNSFKKVSDEVIRLSGVSKEEIKKRLDGTSKEIPSSGKELIQKGHEVKAEAEKYSDKLEKALKKLSLHESYTALPDTPKEEKPMDDKEYRKKRKGKFKRFGSDETWKRL
jgi:uncharacterized phage infection (PIP) family protein YhgE